MTINFAHIVPTPHLEMLTKHNGCHLILAHLVESDETYRQFYANLDDGKEKILDNSGFEMFKQGRPMYSADKLIEMGTAVGADIIVLPDYPMQAGQVTIDAAKDLIPLFKEAGFGTFFVPQSELGEFDDYIATVLWALDNPDIDVIGLSILACPVALGLKEQTYDNVDDVDNSYKMQRFLSRWQVLNYMADEGLLDDVAINRFHCLGMVDGPNEIDLLNDHVEYIRSWDSSSAPWLGLHGNMVYDMSPTGLRNGKYEVEVDFDYFTDNPALLIKALYNIQVINQKEAINIQT